MIEPTNQLIFEVLKKIQGDVAIIRQTQADHGEQFISLRDQIHTGSRNLQTQIHDLQSDALRLEKLVASATRDLDTIKRRLELIDAE